MVSLSHQIQQEQPLFSKLGARLESRNQAQQHMQPRDGSAIDVGDAKRANVRNTSEEDDGNRLGAS